ncbi:hypothetical protein ACFQE8_02315 [Salinirubellus sp. GCM10025818]|uniref:hypothetical protein n=1 Tax=Salinirubellus TaxID=2162630 RepID=UPI0030CD8C6E
MTGSARRTVPPLLVAAADIGVGGLLYQQVSILLGVLLLACGVSVLITVAYEPLCLLGSALWRRFEGETTK